MEIAKTGDTRFLTWQDENLVSPIYVIFMLLDELKKYMLIYVFPFPNYIISKM